jgi:biotin transporter BioY
MPSQVGIMIASVPAEYRQFSSAAGQFFMNLIGFLPAPYLMGFMNQHASQQGSVILLMFWTLFIFIFILASVYFNNRKNTKSEPLLLI